MITPELHAERMRGDWQEMRNIRGPYIEWEAEGTPPNTYVVTYRLRAFVSPTTQRHAHHVQFTLPPYYPEARPNIVMLDRPVVFHPNVFADGRICVGDWRWDEGLGFLVLRVARLLLYFAPPTNPGSPANVAAAAWFRDDRRRFPLERSIVLPDPFTGATPARRAAIVVRTGGLR